MADTDTKATFWKESPELFERYVLVAINTDKKLWYSVSKHLCKNKMGYWVNEFESFPIYVLYRALHYWRELTSGSEFTPISEGGLISSLISLTKDTRPIVSMDNIEEIVLLHKELASTIYPDEAKAVIKGTWRTWLTKKKTLSVVTDWRRSGGSDPDELIEDASNVRKDIASADETEDPVFWSMDMLALGSEQIIERMPLSPDFKNINANLGGGLGKSEHVLAVAPTGGGKTIFACQLATDLALAQRGVVLITTEQHPRELYPRFISNLTYKLGVPVRYDIIKDGFTDKAKKLLTSAQLEAVQKAAKALPSLEIGDWTKGKTIADIPAFLEQEAAKLAAKGFTLDCIILDWIGGALTESVADPQKKRLLMLSAADFMKKLALERNIATVSLAQTSAKGIDVHKVTEQHLGECKSMHIQATAAFGISAVRVNTDSKDESDSYETRQHCFCFKTRKGKGTYFPIKRNFDYQRFEDL